MSYDCVNIGGFYNSCRKIQNGFNNTSFTVTNKASNIAMPVSRFINFHKLRCPIIHYYLYYTISVFVKVLNVLVKNREITLCITKLW